MRRPYAAAVCAAALIAGLTGTDAVARGTVTAPVADYNAALVKTAGGAVTVPYGSTLANALYTVASGTQLEIGSRFTITLPSGCLFSQLPLVVAIGGPVFTAVAGGVGSNSVSYQIGGAAVPSGATVIIGDFSMTGATVLETGFYDSWSMTFQATNNAASGNNDPAPIAAVAFSSQGGAQLNAVRGGVGGIDLAANPPGTAFVPNGATIAGSAEIIVVEIAPIIGGIFQGQGVGLEFPLLTPAGLPSSLSPTDTATITVSGEDFTGIRAAYAGLVAETCATTVPGGSVAGTVTRHLLTFAQVPIGLPIQLCMISDGATLMVGGPGGVSGFQFGFAAGTSTDFLVGNENPTTFTGTGFTYVGGTAQIASNFFTGSDSGYTSLLRINNSGKGDATVIAEFQDYRGGLMQIGSLGTLYAGTGTVFTLAQLEAAVPGLSLANSGQRATLTIIGAGQDANVSAAGLLINPGGLISSVP